MVAPPHPFSATEYDWGFRPIPGPGVVTRLRWAETCWTEGHTDKLTSSLSLKRFLSETGGAPAAGCEDGQTDLLHIRQDARLTDHENS